MTQAEKEIVNVFCRELALALRSITGKNIEIRPEDLPQPVETKPIRSTIDQYQDAAVTQ